MALADQEARRAWRDDPSQGEAVAELDRQHAEQLRDLVERHGWPARSLVGDAGAQAAWLVVEHADHDPEFQRLCLALLEDAAEQGEADPRHVAFLTDRVLIHEGKLQRYGTQLQLREDAGRLVPIRVEAPDMLDERRLSIGLGPIEDYLRDTERSYGLLAPD
jgi:Family of unknown function (DUF6624)